MTKARIKRIQYRISTISLSLILILSNAVFAFVPRPLPRGQLLSTVREQKAEGDRLERASQTPICRIVTRADGRIPIEKLPVELRESELLRQLDDIYHAMAHDETRRILQDNNYETSPDTIQVLRSSLEDAGFQLLSRRDLDLCEALNVGYLLRLSILPDVSKCEKIVDELYDESLSDDYNLFDGRVFVYWRGYSSEVSKGRLLLPKIDYLQASLVQRSAAWLKGKLDVVERFALIQSTRLYLATRQKMKTFAGTSVDKLPENKVKAFLKEKIKQQNETSTTIGGENGLSRGEFFTLARYGGSRVQFVGSPDPTDTLNPFMICEDGGEYFSPDDNDGSGVALTGPASKSVNSDMYKAMLSEGLRCPYDEEAFEAGESIPPMQLLERVSFNNLIDAFSRSGRNRLIETIYTKSKLVEPTFGEVVVVWRPIPEKDNLRPRLTPPPVFYEIADMFDINGLPPPNDEQPTESNALEIRTFEGVPMANILAVLPKTKLVFRPADALVFDLGTIVSFALVLSAQRFDSPRLDLLALISGALWLLRTVFRYSNKLARYDLLVKSFLTSKISYRNAGALKYLADEAGAQRSLRAFLVHRWLSRDRKRSRIGIQERGQTEVNAFIEEEYSSPIDIDAALNDLEDLGLIETEDSLTSVLSNSESIRGRLKEVWLRLFDGNLNLKALTGRRESRNV